MAEELTEEQAQQMMRDFMDGKSNKHSFLKEVVLAKDTTKIGNLSEDELGTPHLDLRGIKELELFSRDVYNDDSWGNFFSKLAEINTSTSLSKNAILLLLAGTDKKEMADMTPQPKRENSGWFKKKG